MAEYEGDDFTRGRYWAGDDQPEWDFLFLVLQNSFSNSKLVHLIYISTPVNMSSLIMPVNV
jgi:hypothetical protein